MLERREWVRANCDHLRTALMLEPRGHADMYGALLTEPERPDSDAGVLFMHNEGYSTMCGHGVIAVVTMAIERGLIVPRNGDAIVLDAPAGQIRARADVRRDGDRTRVERVQLRQRSVVRPARRRCRFASARREVRADVAFGGAFYAIVDAESAGLAVRAEHLAELRRAGMAIKHAVEAAVQRRASRRARTCAASTAPSSPGRRRPTTAHLRNVTIFADAEVDRSPCGTGTCAVMAVLAAMGLLGAGAAVRAREHHRHAVPRPRRRRDDSR